MKKIVEVTDAVGLDALLGENVLLLCNSYFYWGRLTGVNQTQVELTNAHIVYETGGWSDKELKDKQKLPAETVYVKIAAIEAYFARP